MSKKILQGLVYTYIYIDNAVIIFTMDHPPPSTATITSNHFAACQLQHTLPAGSNGIRFSAAIINTSKNVTVEIDGLTQDGIK